MNTIPGSVNNPSGRYIDFPTLRKLRGLIQRSAKLFGKTVISVSPFTSAALVNADALYHEVKHLVAMARKGVRGGATRFLEIGNKVGVSFSSSTATAGPAGVLVDTIAATTATGNWTEVVKTVPVTYRWYVATAADPTTSVVGGTVEDVDTVAITGLTTATEYIFKVRAEWTIGGTTYFTDYASDDFTTA